MRRATRWQDDLPIQVVRLDVSGAAHETLPGRPAAARVAGNVGHPVDTVAAGPERLRIGALDAGGREAGPGFPSQHPGDLRRRPPHGCRRLQRVVQIRQELRVLQAHHPFVRFGAEARPTKGGRQLPAGLIHAAGIAAGVEDTAETGGVGHDFSRREMLRRQVYQHRVHAAESSQRHALVGDAVLSADDAHVFGSAGQQILQGSERVLALHRQNHHVVAL
jgi:hypothetical protein